VGEWWRLSPLFAWELTRLGRARWAFVVRTVYVACLLAAAVWSYETNRDLWTSREKLSQFAEAFMNAVLVTQFMAVMALTPVLVAGSIAGERERGTLDVLLTMPLSSAEIVLGKFVVRLLAVACLMLAGLPVLSLATLWGGVDAERVLFVELAITIVAAGVGATTLASSVDCRTTATATAAGVAWYLGLVGLGIAYALVLVPLIAPFVAVSSLRPRARPRTPPPAPERPPLPTLPRGETAAPGPPIRPPVGDDPLVWRERHVLDWPRIFHHPRLIPGLVTLGVALGTLLVWVVRALAVPGGGTGNGTLALVLVTGLAGWALLAVATKAASSVSRERQRGTLDVLLTLPVERRAILEAKWDRSVAAGVMPFTAIAVLLPVTAVSGAAPADGLFLLALLLAVQGVLAASAGLWVSVRCQSPIVAVLLTVALLAAAAGVPWVFGLAIIQKGSDAFGLLLPYALGIGGTFAAAFGLWESAVRRFERGD
jgi:ABC-type transport system involved in multi-copper enzyme maturation permease subunit